MPGRGFPPAPTAQKIRAGVRPSRINFDEPVPRQRPPRCPSHLTPEARRIWRQVLREAAPGQVVALDAFVLELFSEALARYRRASRTYAESSGIIRGRDGGPVVNPMHRVVRDLADQVRVLARELGLSPSARSALHVPGENGVGDPITNAIGLPPRLRVVGGHGQ